MNANETVSALLDTLGRIRGAEQLIIPKEGIANLCSGLEHAINLIDHLQAKVDFMTEQRDVYMQEATELSQKLVRYAERLKQCLPPWLHIYVDTVGKEIGGE